MVNQDIKLGCQFCTIIISPNKYYCLDLPKNCSIWGMKSDDNELILGLQQNNLESFNAIYWKYHQALYSNIIKLIKDPDTTQDILQEVFIILWEKRFTIDPARPVSNWLFVISYNKSIDYLKKNLRFKVSYGEISDVIDHVDEKDVRLQENQLTLLEKAVELLSPQRKKVFELCKIQRKSYDDAAKEMQISKHTVKEYLSSAVFSIKEYLKTYSKHH